MCQGPIQWLGLHLPCIDSHAVDLAKRDSLFISSAKAKNIKMARWILFGKLAFAEWDRRGGKKED